MVGTMTLRSGLGCHPTIGPSQTTALCEAIWLESSPLQGTLLAQLNAAAWQSFSIVI